MAAATTQTNLISAPVGAGPSIASFGAGWVGESVRAYLWIHAPSILAWFDAVTSIEGERED